MPDQSIRSDRAAVGVILVLSVLPFFFCDGFAEAVLVEDDSRRRHIFIVAAACCSYLLMLLIFDLLFSSFEMGIGRPLLATLLPIWPSLSS